VWKERIYPHLEHHLARHVDSVTVYLLVSHEVSFAARARADLLVHWEAISS